MTGQVLDYDGHSKEDNVFLWEKESSGSKWKFVNNNDGTITLENVHSGKLLDYDGKSDNSNVLLWHKRSRGTRWIVHKAKYVTGLPFGYEKKVIRELSDVQDVEKAVAVTSTLLANWKDDLCIKRAVTPLGIVSCLLKSRTIHCADGSKPKGGSCPDEVPQEGPDRGDKGPGPGFHDMDRNQHETHERDAHNRTA